MINNGAQLTSRKQYKAREGYEIYELHGKVELYLSSSNLTSLSNVTHEYQNNVANLTSNNDADNTNNIELESGKKLEDNNACLKITLRGSRKQETSTLSSGSHSPGSISVYVHANGLVKVFTGDKLQQEAYLHASTKFEYSITDVGESRDVHIDLKSFDTAMNEYSLEILVKANYTDGQMFYMSQSLLGDSSAVPVAGVDMLRILDEISDPQDRQNNQN